LLAGYAALAVAELMAAPIGPGYGPVTAVGGAAIDRTPAAVKGWAIRTFGARRAVAAGRPRSSVTTDIWRQWSFLWKTTPGTHTLTVRATDGTGATQTDQRTRTIPDGASGRHSVVVTVE
jgi:hypothetical protein